MSQPETSQAKTPAQVRSRRDPEDPGLGIIPGVTVVIAVDASTVKEFALSVRTWWRYARPLFDLRWILIYDSGEFTGTPEDGTPETGLPGGLDDVFQAINEHTSDRNQKESDCLCAALDECVETVVPWPFPNHPEWGKRYAPGEKPSAPEYENQREKMLSAFCYAAPYVRTTHWMKIDTDVTRDPVFLGLPLYQDNWITGKGFRDGKPRDVVASPWGYTKPAKQMAEMHEWATNIAAIREISWPNEPKLYLPDDPDATRVRHPRFASWVSIYSKRFTLEAMTTAWQFSGPCKIPIPSQDGYHFYMAEILGAKVERYRFKRLGYRHWVSQKKLKEYVRNLGLI